MAEIDSNATPSLGELMNRLYDVQALMQCASASLDEDGDGNAIRVLRHAEAVSQEVINHLDLIGRPCKSLEMQINRRFSQEIHPAKSLRN